MAKLAYCKICKATYPLNIVMNDGGRSGKKERLPIGIARSRSSARREAAWQEVDTASAFSGPGGAVFVADQASKWLVRHDADHLPYRVVGGLRVDLDLNRGISFSQLAAAGDVVVLVAAVAAGVIAALVFAAPRYRPALGLILGGALGNLIDRSASAGPSSTSSVCMAGRPSTRRHGHRRRHAHPRAAGVRGARA